MTQKGVRISGVTLVVDGTPFYMRAGEVHYFRLEKRFWKDRLLRLQDAGLNTVSSYIPWFWHEPREGFFDFEGKKTPERNLRHFLELIARSGLKFVARPGPFVNSELRFGGYPEWLFRKYPETMSRRADGKPATGRPLPAEGEPTLRRFVERWYSRVVPIIAGFSATRGGPLILFQPDNELSAAWSYGLTNSLYDPSILGRKGREGYWARWLRRRFRKIEAINRRLRSSYKSFAEIEPPRRFPANERERLLAIEWLEFKNWFFADWAATLAAWCRRYGIDVPVIFNEPVAGFYEHGEHPGFGAEMRSRGEIGFSTCHTYSGRIFDLEGLIVQALGLELVKASPWAGPAVSVETNATWFLTRLDRSAVNWAPLLRLGLARGMDGTNIYMFAGGRNPEGCAICGREYWDQAPVGPDGTLNPGFFHIRDWARFVSAWEEEILATREEVDVHICLTRASRYIPFLGAPKAGVESARITAFAEPSLATLSTANEWLGGVEGVNLQLASPEGVIWQQIRELLILLERLNLSWDIVDPCHPNRPPGDGWILVPCVGALERTAIDYLLAHLDEGGGCLFFPTIPTATLDGRRDNRMEKRLRTNLLEKVRPAGGRILDYGWRTIETSKLSGVAVPSWIFLHRPPRGAKALATYERRAAIFEVPLAKGRAIVSGVFPAYGMPASRRLWDDIFRRSAGIKSAVETIGGYARASVRSTGRRGEPRLVTVANLTGEYPPRAIIVRRPSRLKFPNASRLELPPQGALSLWADVVLGGARLAYSTAEITPRDRKRSVLEVRGYAGTVGEFAFYEKVHALWNGKPLRFKKVGRYYVATVEHRSKPGLLRVLSKAEL